MNESDEMTEANELIDRLYHECKGDWDKMARVLRYLETHFDELWTIAEKKRSGGLQ
jgi:hypothetical protein